MVDPSLTCPHVAYAIGRGHGDAVARNRLRRRLRVLLAARADRLAPGWYLVGAEPAAVALDAATLAAEADGLVRRLGDRAAAR